MTTPKQTEPNVNYTLGNLLKGMMPTCTVLAENTHTFPDHPGRHADVLVTATGRSPVVVEAEFEPALEAEKDARERLGLRINGEPRAIEAAVALRYPAAVETAYDLDKALREVTLSYCVLYEDGTRFPESGWLQGSVEDLADLVRLVSVPQKEVEQAADTLEGGIEDAATDLDKMSQSRPDISTKIASLLGMADVPQTRRMACAILANALIFHERIARMHEDVNPLLLLGGSNGAQLQGDTLEAWGKILDIDYYSIFAIARDILMQLPAEEAAQVMGKLRATARNVNATGVDNAHDLTGRIFQRLIADRKYLATFYTRPTLPASNWGVQFICPSGGLLHAMATRCASCLPSNLRSRPGLGLSLMAASSPSSTNRFRTLATVAALTKSTPASSPSRSPSSALSSASARLTVRTDGLPRWETSLRRERSDSVSLTLYLMAAMSGYSPTERLYPSMTAFSYSCKSIWK